MSTPCADGCAGFAGSYRFGRGKPARREAIDMATLSSRCREAITVAVRHIGEIRRGEGVMFVPIVLAYAATWYLIGATAGSTGPANQPVTSAEAPGLMTEAAHILTKSDRLPLSPEFDERFSALSRSTVATPLVPPQDLQGLQQQPQQETPKEIVHKTSRQVDPVCGRRGRYYFHRGGHMSWRCRRR